jgi:peptide chain release factor subunit 3
MDTITSDLATKATISDGATEDNEVGTIHYDKEPVNIVFIGHVDAGKSTIGGHILFLTGMVDQRTMEKYEKESKELNRESWYLSWALDTSNEERQKGITVEVGRGVFETAKKRFNILDAPGHKNYVPNMISGASQADIAILVISSRKGEFETGFERGGQTREHAMLARSLGVKRMVVVINKMDEATVNWSKERYDECVSKLLPYLKQCGFVQDRDLDIIPISGFTGANLKVPVGKEVCPWYNGPTLLHLLDTMPSFERRLTAPFMMPIQDKMKEMGTMVSGKIEAGTVSRGQKLLLMPNKREVDVSAIYFEDDEVKQAKSGDIIRLRLKGVEEEEVSAGFVLCDPEKPVNTVQRFVARINVIEHKNIICPGYTAIMHVHNLAEEVVLTDFLFRVDPKTGEKVVKSPKFIKQGQAALVVVQCYGTICLETYESHPQLGRFTLRDEGKTVAVGTVKKLLNSSSPSNSANTAGSLHQSQIPASPSA